MKIFEINSADNCDRGLAKSIIESHDDRPLKELGAGLDDDLKISVLLYLGRLY